MGSDSPRERELRLRTANLDWLQVEDEVIALDVDRSLYLGTNASGALMWQELAKGTTRSALVDLLVTSYGIDVSTASNDVDSLLRTMDEQGLIDRE